VWGQKKSALDFCFQTGGGAEVMASAAGAERTFLASTPKKSPFFSAPKKLERAAKVLDALGARLHFLSPLAPRGRGAGLRRTQSSRGEGAKRVSRSIAQKPEAAHRSMMSCSFSTRILNSDPLTWIGRVVVGRRGCGRLVGHLPVASKPGFEFSLVEEAVAVGVDFGEVLLHSARSFLHR